MTLRRTKITIGFSTHRPEILPFAAEAMGRHDLILLEDPPTPGFAEMLQGDQSVGEYLLGTDMEFPEFSKHSCLLYQDLWRRGKELAQVEPYLERLVRIHEHLADGGKPTDFEEDSPERRVYESEHRATSTLLAFYASSIQDPFERIVASVKAFARSDAARLMIRDSMRAEAILGLARDHTSIYVESGYIHYPLVTALLRRRFAGCHLNVQYLAEPVVRPLTGRRNVWGPGDRLTLLYAFHPDYTGADADLLAARSLIYIKILEKEEISGETGPYPHTENEIWSAKTVSSLDMRACKSLFEKIRLKKSRDARCIVSAGVRSS
jgi:hypothetical protein